MQITIVSLWAHKLFCPAEPQPFGGAELQLFLLAKELVKYHDVSVRFITRGQGPSEQGTFQGIEVHKLPYRKQKMTRSWLGIWDCVHKCLKEPADIFIQRGGGYETGVTGYAAFRQKKPFLFMTSSTWDVDGTHENKRGWLYGHAYMYGFKKASMIITQSRMQQSLLQERYHRESLILPSSHPIPDVIPARKEGVLWVGRCEECKNPHAFLDVVESLPQFSFTMVCPPANDHAMFEQIQQRAAQYSNLTFLPGLSFDQTEALFASHRVMVNTSIQEGYPNTFVQSFKWGVPIVSALFDPDDILLQHHVGMKQGNQVAKLKEGIEFLMLNQNEWETYSQNARQFALEHHDVQKNARRLYEILKSLIDSNLSTVKQP